MRSRRAVASVVGMVFAIIALTTTITYISYSMGILNNYNQSVLVKNQQLIDTDKEKFQISSVTVPNGNLNITVANTGTLPIQFSKVWVQNTSATDWIESYVPVNNFVSVGGILTNLGQKIPVSINPSHSYNVKLVTSRGNTQQFQMNSAKQIPLSIQLYALPPTVPSGFKTELVMVIINNSTGILTNLVPQISEQPGFTASCTIGTANPSTYSTLLPGSVAIFKWDLVVSGTQGGQSCSWVAQLQNGYPGNTAQTSAAVATIQLADSNYANYAGTLTMDYTQFHWAVNGTSGNTNWYTDWQIPGGKPLAFSIKITNNNATSDFYLSKQTFFWMADPRNGDKANKNFFYIINSTNPTSPITLNAYCGGTGDYCDEIPYNGTSKTIYLGASGVGLGGSNVGALSSGESYDGFLVIFGKFVNHNNPSYIEQYGQNIPFVAIIAI